MPDPPSSKLEYATPEPGRRKRVNVEFVVAMVLTALPLGVIFLCVRFALFYFSRVRPSDM